MEQLSPKGIRVRAARMEDAARIAGLAAELGYPSSATEVRRRLRRFLGDPDHLACVAELSNGRVVGWVHAFVYKLMESDPQAEVGGLVVDKRSRGLGRGKLLMARVESWARAKNLKSVYLRSNIIRKGAHAFYRKLGYRILKTQYAFVKTL